MRHHILDRLVVQFDEKGVPAAASIVDFKTDRSGSQSPVAILESHGQQLARYREAVADHLGLKVGQVEALIVVLETGIVVSVPNSMAG